MFERRNIRKQAMPGTYLSIACFQIWPNQNGGFQEELFYFIDLLR